MKKILIVAEYASSNSNTTGAYWEQIALKLSEYADVTVLCTDYNSVDPRLVFKITLPTWLPSGWLVGRVFYSVAVLAHIIRLKFSTSRHYDLIICSSNPFWFPPLVLFSLPTTRKILVTFDKFPENIACRGNLLRIVGRFLRPIFERCRRAVDLNVVVGRDMIESAVNCAVIPNWATCKIDYSNAYPGSDLKLLYFGNFGDFQALPMLLDQVARIPSDKECTIGFYGAGKYSNRVEAFARIARGKPRVGCFGPVPLSDASAVYSRYNVSLVTLLPGMKGLCVPSKAYNALANGHPVLAFVEPDSEIALLINEFDCGWVLDINAPNALAEFMETIDARELSQKVENVKSIPIEMLSGENSLERYRRGVVEMLS